MALIVLVLVNGILLLSLSRQYMRLVKINYTLIWICLNSLALRHCWKTQIYALMAVLTKEEVLKAAMDK